MRGDVARLATMEGVAGCLGKWPEHETTSREWGRRASGARGDGQHLDTHG